MWQVIHWIRYITNRLTDDAHSGDDQKEVIHILFQSRLLHTYGVIPRHFSTAMFVSNSREIQLISKTTVTIFIKVLMLRFNGLSSIRWYGSFNSKTCFTSIAAILQFYCFQQGCRNFAELGFGGFKRHWFLSSCSWAGVAVIESCYERGRRHFKTWKTPHFSFNSDKTTTPSLCVFFPDFFKTQK